MIEYKKIHTGAFRLSLAKDGQEIGHAYLYLIDNDGHDKPYGYMEDVFVEEDHRRNGYGKELVNAVIALAKERECYKIVGTSRYSREGVHDLYTKLGFIDHGKSFRMNIDV